jgi:hypothetical protein
MIRFFLSQVSGPTTSSATRRALEGGLVAAAKKKQAEAHGPMVAGCRGSRVRTGFETNASRATLFSMNRFAARAIATILTGAVVGLSLTGCAGSAGSGGTAAGAPAAAEPAPPQGEVMAQGMVLHTAGAPELCLGAVAESYPPQCDGIPLAGWSWDGLDGAESSGDARWGTYAVQGTYDGTTFSVTQPPVPLALFDPMPVEDPTGGAPGATDEAVLLDIQSELPGWLGDDGTVYLSSYPQNGRLWVDVVWDDGTYQAQADEAYGDDVVLIRSAIRPVV